MKYKVGDRVEIINYGHQIWEVIPGKKKARCFDLRPELVGRGAVIVQCTEPQPNFERYALEIDGFGYMSWFGLKQLKDRPVAERIMPERKVV